MANVSTMQASHLPPRSPPKAYSPLHGRQQEDSPRWDPHHITARDKTPSPSMQIHRKPAPLPAVKIGEATVGSTPSSPVRVQQLDEGLNYQYHSTRIENQNLPCSLPSSRSASRNLSLSGMTPPSDPTRLSPTPQVHSVRPKSAGPESTDALRPRLQQANSYTLSTGHGSSQGNTPSSSRGHSSQNSLEVGQRDNEIYQPLQYFHQPFEERPRSANLISPYASPEPRQRAATGPMRNSILRPGSSMSSGSENLLRGRRVSHTPDSYGRTRSANSLSRSPDVRPPSYVDLLNVPYPQVNAISTENLHNAHLRDVVGSHASLLSTAQTLEMYRANVKKTNDPAIQYEFAVFMVTCAQEATLENELASSANVEKPLNSSPIELLKEARSILQRLSDRSYPFAQYYLADGYASGLFSKGKEDYDKAFPLFISASKHGHAEAGYRAALCYEFGWGTRSDANKAVQFYRQSASKNHPGAMLRLGRACLAGDLGLVKRYKEGVKWLKRAVETADFQYNSAPYELGVLHETGYGDDIFEDESYAAQLFTKSADLGHPEANYRLGDAYEHGKLTCPRDPALSIHFYTGAAQRGHPLAMMALCAWYMVGADPILEKDENEAFEWAKKAAEAGLPKAEYCVGYFTEMGIGCRLDPLEANVWYVRAADHGDERAKHRLGAIKAAATGVDPEKAASAGGLKHKGDETGRKKKFGIF